MLEHPTRLLHYRCDLKAIDEQQNIAWAYQIDATRDLSGNVIVALRWGRIGRRLARLTVSFESEAAASRFIQRTMARRASAPRWIGVGSCRIGGDDRPSNQPIAVNDAR